ncbi:hypothetical protein [Streptomyces smyrnaeus]|uniref:hypothetical protein n=1 Tax=Streptomyces smyrnaeus TaxID=1387713 RepID=UPI0036C37CFB
MNNATPEASCPGRIRHAVGVLAPPWTSWPLEILRERGPLRACELRDAMPWLNTQSTQQVLLRMQSSGLLVKPDRGCYAPSRLGQHAFPAHRALASWHARHFERNNKEWKRADRAEDALARLRGKGTIEALTVLEQQGPLRPLALREAAGLASGSFHYRTQKLLSDGLVTRLGPDQHSAYTLTPAARQLAPVFAELHDFGRHSQANQPTAEASRARAARQHSPTAPAITGLFSHPPEPQPRVPEYITALSHPSRTR